MAKKKITITYGQIISLIKAKHSRDIFVPECKDGQTWGRKHARLDVWAMKRSYSNFRLSGYEIKMTRADFLSDDKYVDYLPVCNVLWFVAPPGIIDPKELPDEVGLMVIATTGSRLFTKKKAPIRSIKPPVALYEYLLMSRAVITNYPQDVEQTRDAKLKAYRDYLDGKKSLREIGYQLSTKIGTDLRKAEEKVRQAEALVRSYDEIRERIAELGLNPDIPIGGWAFESRLKKHGFMMQDSILKSAERFMTHFSRDLDLYRKMCESIEKGPTDD